ncbi:MULTISPECIES: alpha/beta hydrolase [Aphanothece]|uniref:alpha/beta hydrolase n=1 Tax=Aphanothece TaxID=1121 RepID=UPI00398ED74A
MAPTPFPQPTDGTDAGLIRQGPRRGDQRLVLLHGWGADADDLLDLGALLVGPEVGVVALQAPLPHPAGIGRQWYDLQQPGWPQLPAARADLQRRLLALDAEVPLSATVLLGFSQGAAMALDVGTRGPGLPVAALVGCSGYPHPDWQPGAVQGPETSRILLTHGELDPVVPVAASEDLRQRLSAGGHGVELHLFPGGHTIDSSLFETIRAFIRRAWT